MLSDSSVFEGVALGVELGNGCGVAGVGTGTGAGADAVAVMAVAEVRVTTGVVAAGWDVTE